MGVKMQILPRKGQRYVLAVCPREWYAGKVGVAAVVDDVSDSAVYVLFEGGLRESYPPARFAEYFRPKDDPAVPVPHNNGAAGARTASGNVLQP